MEEMTAEEYRRTLGKAPKSKYGAKVTYVDGIRFSSKAEARRYEELTLQQRAGVISGLTCQPRYEIVAKSQYGRALYYIGDFRYQEAGNEVVEDVKGGDATALPLFRLKSRLFRERYPYIVFRVVKR